MLSNKTVLFFLEGGFLIVMLDILVFTYHKHGINIPH